MHTKSLAVALGPIGIRLSVALLLEEGRFKWTRPLGPMHSSPYREWSKRNTAGVSTKTLELRQESQPASLRPQAWTHRILIHSECGRKGAETSLCLSQWPKGAHVSLLSDGDYNTLASYSYGNQYPNWVWSWRFCLSFSYMKVRRLPFYL